MSSGMSGVLVLRLVFFASLASVLLVRRRVKLVADVLKGIRQKGFTQGGGTLHVVGGAVCEQGLVGPCVAWSLGFIGFLPMGSIRGYLTL